MTAALFTFWFPALPFRQSGELRDYAPVTLFEYMLSNPALPVVQFARADSGIPAMQRKYTAAALGAGSLVGWSLWVLDQIARVQTVYDLIPAIAGVKINWAPVYLCIAITSTTFLVVVSWDWLVALWRRHERTQQRSWDLSLEDAASYVAFASLFGDAVSELDLERKLIRSLQAVWETAREGKIALGGSEPTSALPKPIPKRLLASLTLQYKTTRAPNYGYGTTRIYDIKLAQKSDQKVVVYDKLFAERRRLEEVWPRKPSRL